MSKVMVSWCPDWSDEADFPGFEVMDKEKWQKFEDEIREQYDLGGFVTWGFGTNEYNEYDDVEDILAEFAIVDITVAQAQVLEDLFDSSFGSGLPCVGEDY